MEHVSAHTDLRELEDRPPGMAHQAVPDLDESPWRLRRDQLRKASGRPSRRKEVPQAVGQHEQEQPCMVGHEPVAREPGPVQGVLPLLDPLLARRQEGSGIRAPCG